MSLSLTKIIDILNIYYLKKLKLATIALLESESQTVIDLNQANLAIGYGTDDIPLPEYSWETYKRKKESMGSMSEGRYDMRLTGRSYGTMRVSVNGEYWRIMSDGLIQKFHDGELLPESGVRGRLLGLTEEDKKSFSAFLHKEISKIIKKDIYENAKKT